MTIIYITIIVTFLLGAIVGTIIIQAHINCKLEIENQKLKADTYLKPCVETIENYVYSLIAPERPEEAESNLLLLQRLDSEIAILQTRIPESDPGGRLICGLQLRCAISDLKQAYEAKIPIDRIYPLRRDYEHKLRIMKTEFWKHMKKD